MMRGSPRQAEPTVTDALIEVVDAGHRLVSDRIELAIVEARGIASELAVRVALVMVGALMLTSALVAMDAALVEQMAHWVSRPLALLSCAAVDVLLGGGLILVGVRRREQS